MALIYGEICPLDVTRKNKKVSFMYTMFDSILRQSDTKNVAKRKKILIWRWSLSLLSAPAGTGIKLSINKFSFLGRSSTNACILC